MKVVVADFCGKASQSVGTSLSKSLIIRVYKFKRSELRDRWVDVRVIGFRALRASAWDLMGLWRLDFWLIWLRMRFGICGLGFVVMAS